MVGKSKAKDSDRQDLRWSLLTSVSLLNCMRGDSLVGTTSYIVHPGVGQNGVSELRVCPLRVRVDSHR